MISFATALIVFVVQLSVFALSVSSKGFSTQPIPLQNPSFETRPTNLTMNTTSQFVLLDNKVNVIPGWTFKGTVWYVTAGGNISLPGNGHGVQLGPNGMINQTYKSDGSYDYVVTFTLAPSSIECANSSTAVNVSGPSSSKIFYFRESMGTEMWQTYAYSTWGELRDGLMGDFYKNCKSLSLVFLAESNDVSGAEGLPQCMLHGKAINHHMVLCVDGLEIPKTFKPPLLEGSRCRLQLPKNWYNDFSGFLMCAVLTEDDAPDINLKHEQSNTMGMNLEAELWNECNDDDYVTSVSYVSFDSLRHTTWWDSNSNAVSFSFEGCQNIWCSGFGVKLVARENESVTTETATDSSEFWEDEDDYTFKFNFVDDTKSSLKLRC